MKALYALFKLKDLELCRKNFVAKFLRLKTTLCNHKPTFQEGRNSSHFAQKLKLESSQFAAYT